MRSMDSPGSGQPFSMETASRQAVSVELWGVRPNVFEIRLILGALNDYEAPSVALSADDARALARTLGQFAHDLEGPPPA